MHRMFGSLAARGWLPVAAYWAFVAAATAQGPLQISYQGRLTRDDGTPISSSLLAVFRIVAGGATNFTEATTVAPDVNGVFQHVVGSVTQSNLLEALTLGAEERFLEVEIDGEVLEPPSRLVTVPYAVVASTVRGNSAIVIGSNAVSPAVSGAIRWTGSDFEGYDGRQWVPLTRSRSGSIVPEGMNFIPGGLFQMGDSFAEGFAPELPVHTVLVSAFYMDKYEVTNQEMADTLQWAYANGLVGATVNTVTNNEGSAQELLDLDDPSSQITFSNGTFSVHSGKTNFPCIDVSWFGAQAYCNYRSDREGLSRCIDFADWRCDFSKDGFRLPTEAEWEKAARGGLTGHHYPWPSSGGTFTGHIDGGKANYAGSGDPFEANSIQTSSVGYYDGNQTPPGAAMANGYDLHDMSGNVWEWCYDWFSSSWYSDPGAVMNDPTGPSSGDSRVLRGGSWSDVTVLLRCANRGLFGPGSRNFSVGLRAVRGL